MPTDNRGTIATTNFVQPRSTWGTRRTALGRRGREPDGRAPRFRLRLLAVVTKQDDETRGARARPTRAGATTSRRRFLRAGISGVLLLGAGGLLARETSGYEVPDAIAARLVALSAKEYRIVEAIAHRVLAPDDPPEGELAYPRPETLDVGVAIDGFVAKLDDENRRDLLRLLHVVEHLLPLERGLFSRFTRLGPADQDRVLGAMETSPIGLLRGAFGALKSLSAMSYFSHPLAWGPLGYDGPLVARPAEGWFVQAEHLARPAR